MKYLVAIILLVSCTMANAITPLDTRHKRESVTVDYLLESCAVIGETAGGMIPFFDCESYLYGVIDSHLAVRALLKPKQQACFPADIAPWQVYEDIQQFIPQSLWHKPAAPLIIEALRTKYPCK
jgi:hypothetical protein